MFASFVYSLRIEATENDPFDTSCLSFDYFLNVVTFNCKEILSILLWDDEYSGNVIWIAYFRFKIIIQMSFILS